MDTVMTFWQASCFYRTQDATKKETKMIKTRKMTEKDLKELGDLMLKRLDKFNSIAATKAMVKDLWIKACEFDGIDPAGSFVVLSDEIPFAKGYNIAIGNLIILEHKNTIRLV